jgi:hypothetical protein
MTITFADIDQITDSRLGTNDIPCPECGPDRRAPANRKRLTMRVWRPEPEYATWYCARCRTKGGARADGTAMDTRRRTDKVVLLVPAERAPDTAYKVKRARELFDNSLPALDNLPERYLAGREIDLPRGTPLRYCPMTFHWPSGQRLPAMVAPIVGIASNEVQAVHLTFLTEDGRDKAAVDKPRLYLGPKSGGVVKLTPDEDVLQGLAIGEGLETCLTAILAGYPTWASLDSGNLAAFPVLPGVDCLNVLADHDLIGIAAAEEVAARWRAAGREARVLKPARVDSDWNDELREPAHA